MRVLALALALNVRMLLFAMLNPLRYKLQGLSNETLNNRMQPTLEMSNQHQVPAVNGQ